MVQRRLTMEIAKGDLTDEINKLKGQQNGSRDIIVYGGASFDSSLIKTGGLITNSICLSILLQSEME
jgi:hypothetical protein